MKSTALSIHILEAYDYAVQNYSHMPRVMGFVELLNHKTTAKLAPLQNTRNFHIPGLLTKAWHDEDFFSWAKILRKSYPCIKKEFISLVNSNNFEQDSQKLSNGGNWKMYHLYRFGLGRDAKNCLRCPVTAEIIREHVNLSRLGMVYFSILEPGTHVRPHCGPTNARIRCHLGLLIPDDCGLRVGPETRRWKEGGTMIFDESFEHEAWNHGNTIRAVLIVDSWHPDLTNEEIQAIQSIISISKMNPLLE